MRVSVEVENDHLERLTSARKPVIAIAELIWNALDADACNVFVTVKRNDLTGKEIIRVEDDGEGIEHLEALRVFGKLGGSWKKEKRYSQRERRMLHGQKGEGRYKAFGIGNRVRWSTAFEENGQTKAFTISARRPHLKDFEISEPKPVESTTGTVVEIHDLRGEYPSIDDATAVASELAIRFALYLRQYQQVSIWFDGVKVDHTAAESHYKEYELPRLEMEDGTSHSVTLAVIEWKVSFERALYYCDESGFAMEQRPPGIKEPGFTFTAYLKSEAVRQLEERAAFAFGEGHPEVDRLHDMAKAGMKEHFRRRRAELAQGLVEEWKAQKVYPYEGEPSSLIERTERQVFDVVAKNVNDYLPTFSETDAKSKRFSLRLLRQALETSPSAVRRIMQEVLELPKEKAEDLAGLLDRTTLSAVINATKVVVDRLDFLRGLEILLYEPESKDQLLERSQLQKILEEHTWLFGEEFTLSVADQSLDEVLKAHRGLLGRDEEADYTDEVTRPDGSRGIVDLMLSRAIPQARDEEREHLVVELKRPKQKITSAVLTQTMSYALAVAKDERFRDTKTKWYFWAVSNELDDTARSMVSASDRPFGLHHRHSDPDVEVWAMPWSAIIRGCVSRMSFFRKGLEYTAGNEAALALLREMHDKYLPSVLKEEKDEASA